MYPNDTKTHDSSALKGASSFLMDNDIIKSYFYLDILIYYAIKK